MPACLPPGHTPGHACFVCLCIIDRKDMILSFQFHAAAAVALFCLLRHLMPAYFHAMLCMSCLHAFHILCYRLAAISQSLSGEAICLRRLPLLFCLWEGDYHEAMPRFHVLFCLSCYTVMLFDFHIAQPCHAFATAMLILHTHAYTATIHVSVFPPPA